MSDIKTVNITGEEFSKENLVQMMNELRIEKWLCSSNADDIESVAKRSNVKLVVMSVVPENIAGIKTANGELLRADKLVKLVKEKKIITLTDMNGSILAVLKVV